MATKGQFAIVILYLVYRWFLSRIESSSQISDRVEDGQSEGNLTHRYIQIKKTLNKATTDVKFHYVESVYRNCECVVFLHGYMDSWKLWQHSLESLAKRYYVVAFDLKGCGQSSMNYPQELFPEVKDPGGDYTLTLQADEIATALDQLGIKRFNLVTLDLGSIIGDLLAGKYCDRIIRYIRCQQPLVGHFRSAIPQGQFLRRKRTARLFTVLMEADASSLLRVLYGRTGWPWLDRKIKRTKQSMPDSVLESGITEVSYPFQNGPRKGKPGTFICAWAGLYQHNQDYQQFVQNNLQAYRKYTFPVFLFQGIHDIAMPPERFDGSTGMAFKSVRTLKGSEIILSRPFDRQGRGLEDGYQPWGNWISNCDQPLQIQEFFPNSPSVQLQFFDAGHFIPLEVPETFTSHLEKALASDLCSIEPNNQY